MTAYRETRQETIVKNGLNLLKSLHPRQFVRNGSSRMSDLRVVLTHSGVTETYHAAGLLRRRGHWLFVGHRRARRPSKVNDFEAFEADLAAPIAKVRAGVIK